MKSEVKSFFYADLTEADLEALSDCFWGLPGEERYHSTDLDEAIESILDECDGWSDELELVAMRPIKLPEACVAPDCILESIIDTLDADYGDPEDDATEPTEAMLQAARQLGEVLLREYKPWFCEEAARVVLADPHAWIERHCPEWLK